MSYVDRKPAGNRTAIVVSVALLHGAAIYALVTGLAAKYVPIIDIIPEGRNIPIDEIDPPPPPPPAEDTKPEIVKDPVIDAPRPKDPLLANGDTIFIPPVELPQISRSPIFVPEPPPPSPAFTPQGPKPRSSPASWFSTSDYPSRDLREGNQGTARFVLNVSVKGRVTGCSITKSTGFGGLDEATCKYAIRRATFEPATNESGSRVAGTYSGSITWLIPD